MRAYYGLWWVGARGDVSVKCSSGVLVLLVHRAACVRDALSLGAISICALPRRRSTSGEDCGHDEPLYAR
jgi:hypothetical protein